MPITYCQPRTAFVWEQTQTETQRLKGLTEEISIAYNIFINTPL